MQQEEIHISRNLVLLNYNAKNKESIIHALCTEMKNTGYVNEMFESAVLSRESKYPTGLKIGRFNIAIPHTEPQYVSKPCIGIATLQQSVSFNRMDCSDQSVDVNVVLLLALNQGHTHMEVLRRIIEMCQSEEVIDTLMKSSNEQVVVDIVNERISGGE